MGSREDDAWWDTKYAEGPDCEIHGDMMYYDPDAGGYRCFDCVDEEDMQNG